MKEGCGILLIKYSMSCEGIIVRMNNENELEKMAVVSIIIPVYNVYEYIDKCMESVVNQTYGDLEIILINDGSTDGSDKKCEEWAIKDKRIRYVGKENEGLGPTRNLGLNMASADYVMFVDSDDWVDATIVEKLYCELLKTDSDIAVCDRYEVKLDDSSLKLITQEMTESEIYVEKNPDIITMVSTSAWAKLYKKSLYIDNDVEQPMHYYEDVTTLLLLALSKRICYVKEALYYYVVDRSNSITNDISGLRHLVDYLETMVELFKKHDLFEQYNLYVKEVCRKRVGWNLMHASKVLQYESEIIFRQNVDFLGKYWSKEELGYSEISLNLEKLFYCWGSYNLMIAMKMLMHMKTIAPPVRYQGFSSLISAMDNDGNLNEVEVYNENSFRKQQIINEFKRDFANKNIGEFVEVEYFVVDFLEERFDIGVYKGRYFTISDAFNL